MVRFACLLVAIASCSFAVAPASGGDDDGGPPTDPTWWDPAFAHRRTLVVTPGPTRPDKGYAGYTVRLELPRAELTGLGAACDDLRIVTGTGPWVELPRHVAACGEQIDVRFALPVDLEAAPWRDATVYWDNPGASAASAVTTDGVYLWWDDARIDRGADYVRGRMDQWLATGHDDSLAWDPQGFYTYDTTDDSQSGYRRAIDERDVLIETEWFHTGCYPFNMHSGVCVRGVPLSGTGSSELSNHYYCSGRAQNPSCANNDQGLYDGDIVKIDNEILAIDNPFDPPPIVPSQWRKQALAAFGTAPTQLRFWDADASWPALAMPPASALLTTGADASDLTAAGFAGIMTAQDAGRVRNIVIRRYVEPEPVVTVEPEQVAR